MFHFLSHVTVISYCIRCKVERLLLIDTIKEILLWTSLDTAMWCIHKNWTHKKYGDEIESCQKWGVDGKEAGKRLKLVTYSLIVLFWYSQKPRGCEHQQILIKFRQAACRHVQKLKLPEISCKSFDKVMTCLCMRTVILVFFTHVKFLVAFKFETLYNFAAYLEVWQLRSREHYKISVTHLKT